MELLNASILKGAVSTRNRTNTKVTERSHIVVLPRTKVLVEGLCTKKHEILYDV
jgi:hypothetical protein